MAGVPKCLQNKNYFSFLGRVNDLHTWQFPADRLTHPNPLKPLKIPKDPLNSLESLYIP